MSEKNRNWEKQSQQDWDRNRNRYNQDYDRDKDYHNQSGNYANENYVNRRHQDDDDTMYDGGASNYRTNSNWQREQSGYGNPQSSYGNRSWGNKYGSQYNTGYGNRSNRGDNWNQNQYSQGMYGNEYPSYRQNYNSNDYGANAGYLGGQGGYNPNKREGSYENANRSDYDRDWWDKTRDEVSSWFGDEDAERRRRADQQMAGQHRGKGPKGYTRSDQRIQEDVCDRLSYDDRLDATNIEVKVQDGEVTLSGTVTDRDQKRRAEDLVERILGVRDVENHIKVNRPDRESYSSVR